MSYYISPCVSFTDLGNVSFRIKYICAIFKSLLNNHIIKYGNSTKEALLKRIKNKYRLYQYYLYQKENFYCYINILLDAYTLLKNQNISKETTINIYQESIKYIDFIYENFSYADTKYVLEDMLYCDDLQYDECKIVIIYFKNILCSDFKLIFNKRTIVLANQQECTICYMEEIQYVECKVCKNSICDKCFKTIIMGNKIKCPFCREDF